MSNLNTHGVVDYWTARAFLDARGKSRVKVAYETELVSNARCITVLHHGSPIIEYGSTGKVSIRNAGWLSATTTDRLHRMTPPSVRVTRAKGGHVESPRYTGPQPHEFVRVI